jgi:hypothetical protein
VKNPGPSDTPEVELMHDLLNLSAMLLSGMFGALLVAPTRRTFAFVRRRIEDEFDR